MLPLTITRTVGNVSHFLMRNAPTIWTVAGTTAMIGSTALAVKASMDYKAEVTEPLLTTAASIAASSASEEEKAKANKKIRNTLIFATVRRFAIPIALGVAGIAAIAIGHGVAVGRIGALSAALSAETARANGLVDKFANALPEAIAGADPSDLAAKGVVDGIVSDTMNKVNEKSLGDETDANIWFDAENPNWDASEVISQTFINAQVTYLNQRLYSRGYISLNDVYKAFGMPETRVGAVMGWDLKQDSEAIIDLHEVKEYIGAGADRIAVWGFNIDAPHNLVA